MGPADVHEVLDALAAVEVRAVLDGGWGVDALLGRQTRPHRDLDVVIPRGDLSRAEQALQDLGFTPDPSAVPGLPARRVVLAADGRSVDLHLVVMDDRGNGWQELEGAAWGQYPADGLTGSGHIAGRRVPCVTADLQLRHHLGYPPLEHDLLDMRALGERFGLALPPGWLDT